jgi:hypothetical protein
MNKHRLILAAVVVLGAALLVSTAGSVLAQSNPSGVTIPFSSRLTDEGGQPVADGAYAFVFELYGVETGGQALWSEMHTAAAVKNGSFAVVLGEVTAIPTDVADRKELWLVVSVRGPNDKDFTLLTPRQRFAAPASPNALTCPHNHFTDYWSGNSSTYGIEIDQAGTGDGIRSYTHATTYDYASFYGVNTGLGTALYGYSSAGRGVYALSDGTDAIEAITNGSNKSALYAHTTATGANGVWATSSTGRGVYGYSMSGDAIEGVGHSVDRSGIYGRSDNGGWGVSGYTRSTLTTRAAIGSYNEGNGPGMLGQSAKGFGVSANGNDASFYDLLGDLVLGGTKGEIFNFGDMLDLYTNDYVSIDLDNDNNDTNSDFAILNGGDTAVFHVYENGNMTATGTKSAEVKTASYGPRLLYAVESPEVWFEDIGTAHLKDGAVTVKFEPIFAETVDLKSDYHVYVTPICEEAVVLFVSAKTADGFTVQGVTLNNRPSSCAFDYRVMAKRLGYGDVRLAPALPSDPTHKGEAR